MESNNPDYSKLTTEQLFDMLGSDPALGLSEKRALENLSRYGPNEVPEKKVSPVKRLASKFWGFTAWMLELVMVFSIILGRYFDFYVIGALIIVNAVIGFAQEQKASSAVDALRKKLQTYSRVLRSGKWQSLPSKELVPGDVVRVRSGDFVPADLRLFSKGELEVDQSMLTGESIGVEKHENDFLYSGSIIKRGEGNAIVVATGAKTYYGKTTELLQSAKIKLHMEEVVSRVIRWLLAIVVTLVGVLFIVSFAKGINILDAVSLSLVLIVFAVPVALPAMFTVSMAIGSQELVKKGVLVTRLSASEDAASMDTLCADKTGTITVNKLSVKSLVPVNGFSEDELVLYGALASQEANQDPIDLAFISAARSRNIPTQSYTQEQFVPFDSQTRRTEALISLRTVQIKSEFRVMKGAVDVIASACGDDLSVNKNVMSKINDFAKRGYRTLAVASTSHDGALKMCGIVALYDSPREDSKKLIEELRRLGVRVKMLTGDALPIATEIATEVGIYEPMVRAPDLRKLGIENSKEAAELAERSGGFAEIYPEDKYIVVKSLQANGHIVGMTGDGVNDAPALRQAEVGIAVSNATDVAKGAASVVLTSEGLSNIVDLIKTGRIIYQRIVTWILNKVVRTFEVAVFVALAFLITGYYVVSSLDLILFLFLTDFVTISLSTDIVTWSKKPDRWDVSSLAKVGVFLGALTVAELFGLLYLGIHYLGLSSDAGSLQTFFFTSLMYMGLFTVIIIRERKHFWDSMPSLSLAVAVIADMLVVAVLVTFGLPGVKPIPFTYVLSIFGYVAAFSFLINDRLKSFIMKKFGVSNNS
ncbi:MAG: plasma-membrane proton-efflux P-type ATPase [Conexivisphaerales archaeon]